MTLSICNLYLGEWIPASSRQEDGTYLSEMGSVPFIVVSRLARGVHSNWIGTVWPRWTWGLHFFLEMHCQMKQCQVAFFHVRFNCSTWWSGCWKAMSAASENIVDPILGNVHWMLVCYNLSLLNKNVQGNIKWGQPVLELIQTRSLTLWRLTTTVVVVPHR